jgi:tetratricopeptide (TPR) repeat protein
VRKTGNETSLPSSRKIPKTIGNRPSGDSFREAISRITLLIWTLIIAGTVLIHCPIAQGQKSRTTRRPAAKQTLAPSSAEFDEAVKLADEARLAGRLDEAIRLYGKALRIRPKWPDGWWYIGAILYEKDQYEQARDAFQNVVALEPERGPAWGMLGLSQFQTREYERAVMSLQRGRSLGLGENREVISVVRYHAALLYIRFEQFEISFDILSEFVRDGNESSKVIEAFGLTMLRMPLLPKEIASLKREQITLAGQAGFSMAARRLDQARTAFDRLLQAYGQEPNVHYAFGVYLLPQDADAAMKEFQKELEISQTHHPAMVQMAFEYLKRDEHEKALPLAERAVQIAPKMFPARNVLGRVLLELGQVERAAKELEEGVRIAPSSPEMHFALARAYIRLGRKEDAQREREIFKRLQDEYERQRDARRLPETDKNQKMAKP